MGFNLTSGMGEQKWVKGVTPDNLTHISGHTQRSWVKGEMRALAAKAQNTANGVLGNPAQQTDVSVVQARFTSPLTDPERARNEGQLKLVAFVTHSFNRSFDKMSHLFKVAKSALYRNLGKNFKNSELEFIKTHLENVSARATALKAESLPMSSALEQKEIIAKEKEYIKKQRQQTEGVGDAVQRRDIKDRLDKTIFILDHLDVKLSARMDELKQLEDLQLKEKPQYDEIKRLSEQIQTKLDAKVMTPETLRLTKALMDNLDRKLDFILHKGMKNGFQNKLAAMKAQLAKVEATVVDKKEGVQAASTPFKEIDLSKIAEGTFKTILFGSIFKINDSLNVARSHIREVEKGNLKDQYADHLSELIRARDRISGEMQNLMRAMEKIPLATEKEKAEVLAEINRDIAGALTEIDAILWKQA